MIHELLGGRYELHDLLGSGGMARVFRAYDRTLKREVAIKILTGDTHEEAASVERFRREARAAGNLSHPNIVGIYDWGEIPTGRLHLHPTYYMVMELVPGENLKEIIDRRGPLPESEALDIAAQIASALQAAHDHGVIHRDVKPQNILIGGSGQVKMTDFGIARAAGLTQLTATDVICGTPYYLSPEQAQRRPLDSRSDVYGLGVVLYEMLTGSELFHGTPLEVATQHVQEEAPSPRTLQPGISGPTEAIVRKALAKKPEHRFQSAIDMHLALRQARSRLAMSGAPTVPEAARARPRRAPGASGLTTQWRLRQIPAKPYLGKDGTPATPWGRVLAVVAVIGALTGGLAYLDARNSSSSHGKAPVAAAPNPTHTPVAHNVAPPTAARAAATSPAATTIATATTKATAATVSTPASGVAAVSPSQASPVDAVNSFYRLVSAHRFAAAAALWTRRFQASYPPAVWIDKRFSNTASIVVTQSATDAIDASSGTAVVAVRLIETKASGATTVYSGTWNLVLGPSGWLLDFPNLSQNNALIRPNASSNGDGSSGSSGDGNGNGNGNGDSGD